MPIRAINSTMPERPSAEADVAAVLSLLSRLRTSVQVRRVTKGNRILVKNITLTSDGMALEYTPTKKGKRQLLLFSDLYEVTRIDPSSKVYHKVSLNSWEDVIVKLNTRTHYGWRLAFQDMATARTWMHMIAYVTTGSATAAAVAGGNVVSSEDTLRGHIRAMWERADANRDGKIDVKEAKKLMVRMNVEIDDNLLADLLRKHDASGDGTLDLQEFTTLFMELAKHEELRPLFRSLAASPDCMTRKEFDRFVETQGEKPSDAVFQALLPSKEGHISFTTLVFYLLSARLNPALDPAHQTTVVDNMNRPLKDYFVNSSHNTYLSGNQFRSSSDIDMYKRALLAGCRCVELDCWDGADGEPIIYHGYTRTSKIRFADVMDTVRRHAFTASPYLVILSLEVHTSEEQCKTMADHLRRILGDTLVTADDIPSLSYTPDSLKGKVLVKWKLPGKDVDDVEDDATDTDSGDAVAATPLKGGKTETSVQGALSRLLSECVTVGAFKTADWGHDAEPYYIQSYVETKVNVFAAAHAGDFIGQTSRMMVRVYPKGTRIGSSNYNPTTSWLVGAQVVALNYQTWDDDMRVNDGMFSLNRGCGYVLKPEYLRNPNGPARATPCVITVTVMSGAHIPKPSLRRKGDIVDPYVKLSINKRERTEVKTRVVRNNGLNPVWMEEFSLSCASKEVDLLTIKVMDEDTTSANDAVCEMVIPVRALRSGYRAVPMKLCKNGASLPGCSILCKFTIVDTPSQ